MNSIRRTQEQLYVTPKIGYVDCDAKFHSDAELLHLWATFSGDIYETTRTTNSRRLQMFLSSNSKHDFCYTMANIFPSHIQQCLNLTMHFSLRHLAAKMLSQLYNNFISFPYFFPSSETCSININPLFHAAIKNLHIKPYGIFCFVLLLFLIYLLLKVSEEVTKHTHACFNFSLLKIITIYHIAEIVT